MAGRRYLLESSIVADSYAESNRSTDNGLGAASGTLMGQSFTGNGGVLATASFFIYKSGTPPVGNVVAEIYTHTGTFGSTGQPGVLLATSNGVSVPGLSTTQSLVSFTFTSTNKITLVNGTNYFVILDYAPGTTYLQVGYDDTAPTHAGNYYDDVLFARNLLDTCFYVNTDTVPTDGYLLEDGTGVLLLEDVVAPTTALNTADLTAFTTATPSIEFTGTDASPVNDVRYNVQVDNVSSAFGSIVINKVSGTDAGFVNTITAPNTDPFNSGEKASYTVQAANSLANGTYYWRARGIDPNGSNTYGAWATTRSFTVTVAATTINQLLLLGVG